MMLEVAWAAGFFDGEVCGVVVEMFPSEEVMNA